MRIYLGSDHAGYALKNALVEHLKSSGKEAVDLGVFTDLNKVDYPDIAREVAEKVKENEGALGVLVCGTGMGIAIAANKVKGIRAATIHDLETARMARAHNNANIVTLGGRLLDAPAAIPMVDAFLSAEFEGGRHEARIEKITALENER